MEITVIIPTYKPQDYLWECLQSLYRQTLPKDSYEVLIVLNGCDAPYRESIEKYLSTDVAGMNTRLIQTDAPGVSNARNIALNHSSGKYITFIDDDDFVSPEYLQELHSKASDSTIVIARPFIFNDGCLKQLPYRSTFLFESLSHKGKQSLLKARKLMHITCIKLFPREMIGDRRYDKSFSVGEDTLMMFLLSDKIKFVDFTSDKAMYYRRVREGGAVGRFNSSGKWTRAKNSFRLIGRYTTIYLSAPFRYSFIFYATRVWGALHSIVKI